jgi:hypothetical protein
MESDTKKLGLGRKMERDTKKLGGIWREIPRN